MTDGMTELGAERRRLEQQRRGEARWRLWGPYLAERAWGTVREDYSADSQPWEYFEYDQARLRAYRWSEDGLGGICDDQQRLCFALALWNGRDPFLKERTFGLTGRQGNRGEDVKEMYFYLDATPTHSYLRYRYKYPHQAFPYERLLRENRALSREDPPFNLLDTGLFDDNRYCDVDISYAKSAPDEILIHIRAHNRGRDPVTLHLLPSLWFRNTWSWGDPSDRPELSVVPAPPGAAWAARARHPGLGAYYLAGAQAAELLFTENESHTEVLWRQPNPTPYVKDAFHRRVIQEEVGAVNPEGRGTKLAAWSDWVIPGRASVGLDLVLTARLGDWPFSQAKRTFARRKWEAMRFYDELLPEASAEDRRLLRLALAGMIWTKQFFHYDVDRWLEGDLIRPPPQRACPGARNTDWRHLRAADVISMPDSWEYPWFAAWDLAYHCAALALVDVDFAKDQIELMVSERYQHPDGRIPAYEWDFGDTNPPVLAMGALKTFRSERVQRGRGDLDFLGRVFYRLLRNHAWWLEHKDASGLGLFEGGFLGLDNISALNRSALRLPPDWVLKQADATGWMAMYSLNLTVMALELAVEEPLYEDAAIQCYEQFLVIADAVAGSGGHDVPLWDEASGFFMDTLVRWQNGQPVEHRHIKAFSWVGLIPLFATEVIGERLLKRVPRFRELMTRHKGGLFRGRAVCACPEWENERGERLLALVDPSRLGPILSRLLDEDQLLSRYGVRSISRIHSDHREVARIPGSDEPATIDYVPGESTSPMFGGNSNWRGPVWIPTNYSLIQALERFHRFLGPGFRVPVPCLGGEVLTLGEVAGFIARRLGDLYRRDSAGRVPALRVDSPFQYDAAWEELTHFYEYFHAETGQGLGAAHQTGWTGLIANLVMRRYRRDVTSWSGLDAEDGDSRVDELA